MKTPFGKWLTISGVALAITAFNTSTSLAQLPATTTAADCACACKDSPPAAKLERGPDLDTSVFVDALRAHGQWVELANYGSVWIPSREAVGPDFRPYATHGQWVYEGGAWTWASSLAWGWAPFHYGRWVYTVSHGYAWIPGQQWAPAWVAWRFGANGYVGWAPLAPEVEEINAAAIEKFVPQSAWIFVPAARVLEPLVHRYIVAPELHQTVYTQTTLIKQTTIIAGGSVIVGPAPRILEAYVATPIVVRQLSPDAIRIRTALLPPRTIVVAAKARPVAAGLIGMKLNLGIRTTPVRAAIEIKAPAVVHVAPAAAVVRVAPAAAVHVAPAVVHVAPVTAHVAPVTAHVAPVTAHVAPVTAHVAPVTAHVAPVTAHVAPVTAHVAPVTAHVAPVTAHVAPVTAHIAPVTAHIAPVTAHIAPVTAHVAPAAPATAHVAPAVAIKKPAPAAAAKKPAPAAAAKKPAPGAIKKPTAAKKPAPTAAKKPAPTAAKKPAPAAASSTVVGS